MVITLDKSKQTACYLFLAIALIVGISINNVRVSYAQESLKIAAVVNDDVISALDLHSRTLLVMILSKLPRNQQTVERLRPQILRLLIDEKLKLQEAERLGIQVSPAELDNALASAERINRFAPGQLVQTLDSLGVDIETLLTQAKAEISWSRIVPLKYGNNVEVTENDIAVALAKAEKLQNQPHFLMSEIVLPVDNPSKDISVRTQAQELIRELKSGANFESLARTFSESPTASNGGLLDWIRLDQLPDNVAQVVGTMRPGQVSSEIALPAAYIIINLHEVKAGGINRDKSDVTVDLTQFHIALSKDAAASSVESSIQLARRKTLEMTSCEAFDETAKQFGSPLSGRLGKISLAKLPAHLADTVANLKLHTSSSPIRTDDAVIVLMVCERIEPTVPSDTVKKQRIRQQLFGSRISVYARQAIRDLRRAAFIEIR